MGNPEGATATTPAAAAPADGAGLVAGPGDKFEVVKLKYADVSEIVGLLTGNQNIKSNDEFSPEEPNFGSASNASYFGGGQFPSSPILANPNNAPTDSDSVG